MGECKNRRDFFTKARQLKSSRPFSSCRPSGPEKVGIDPVVWVMVSRGVVSETHSLLSLSLHYHRCLQYSTFFPILSLSASFTSSPPPELYQQQILRMRNYGNDGEITLVRTVIPENAISTRCAVLCIAFENLFSVRSLKTVKLVGFE